MPKIASAINPATYTTKRETTTARKVTPSATSRVGETPRASADLASSSRG